MKLLKRMKASIKRALEHMAQENQKEFGNGVPDCCKMNRQASDRQRK